jgi:hypothetical protein
MLFLFATTMDDRHGTTTKVCVNGSLGGVLHRLRP